MNRLLPEPAATQLNRLQLRAALESIPPIPRDMADRLIARANAEYDARKAARPSYTEASEAELDDYAERMAKYDADTVAFDRLMADCSADKLMPFTKHFFPQEPSDDARRDQETRRGFAPSMAAVPRQAGEGVSALPRTNETTTRRRILTRAAIALAIGALLALTYAAWHIGKAAAEGRHRAVIDRFTQEAK